MSPKQAITSCFSKYATFSGRAPRSEFWWFALFYVVVNVFARVVDGASTGLGDTAYLELFTTFALISPGVSVSVRRLHDFDRTGWWWWLSLIPLVGVLILLLWFCQRGTDGPNRFDGPPIEDAYSGGFMDACRYCVAQWITFSGRGSRSEYWWFTLFTTIVGIAPLLIIILFADENGQFRYAFQEFFVGILIFAFIFLVIARISAAIRRLHDVDWSGWWWWLGLVPVIGWAVMLFWLCSRGTQGPNRYGQNPQDPLAEVFA